MPLEIIFLRNELDEKGKVRNDINEFLWVRTECRPAWTADNPGFYKDFISLAGLDIQNGKLMNPEDLLDVHELSDEFVTFKCARARFIKSDVY